MWLSMTSAMVRRLHSLNLQTFSAMKQDSERNALCSLSARLSMSCRRTARRLLRTSPSSRNDLPVWVRKLAWRSHNLWHLQLCLTRKAKQWKCRLRHCQSLSWTCLRKQTKSHKQQVLTLKSSRLLWKVPLTRDFWYCLTDCMNSVAWMSSLLYLRIWEKREQEHRLLSLLSPAMSILCAGNKRKLTRLSKRPLQ